MLTAMLQFRYNRWKTLANEKGIWYHANRGTPPFDGKPVQIRVLASHGMCTGGSNESW